MKEQMQWIRPEEIEARSMEIIESEMPRGSWSPGELAVVRRCIHTSADFDYAENLYFSEHAVEKALEIFRKGGFTIVTDTNMAASGINKKALEKLGGRAVCFMAEEQVAAEAKKRGGDKGSCQHGICGRSLTALWYLPLGKPPQP